MPLHTFPLDIVWLTCEDDSVMARAVLFPELSSYGDDENAVRRQLLRNARRVIESLDPGEVYHRQPSGHPELGEVRLEIAPPPHIPFRSLRSAWEFPMAVDFHYVTWLHGDAVRLAQVPLLDVLVICGPDDDVAALVQHESRFALQRMPEPTTLETLCQLRKFRWAKLERASFQAEVMTLKEHFGQSEQSDKKQELEKVATNLDAVAYPPVFEREELVGKLAECLTGGHPRSVLLVGPSGAGKTALVHELHRRRDSFELGRSLFWSTSGARMVAGMSGFGMWEERCQEICSEAAKGKSVIHFGHLIELLNVGKSICSDQGIGDHLGPYIERGDLVGIAECTAEQLSIIERESPRVMRAFFRLDVPEPAAEAARRIIQKSAEYLARGRDVTLSDDGAEVLERLHRRYATYSAFPGRPLRFLRNLLERSGDHEVVSSADVTRAFMRETGLPLHLLEDSENLDLAATRQWLARRVIGQSEAVDVIVNLLAGIKAGLTRPNQPIASLLFIGPTGVGKTEMAKALAEFLYRDSQRMTRIDMSEYSDASSAVRLAEGLAGAEGVLTSKIREQPFGVVLLDEFEKAHPAVFDLLLQVLGEGRLTDGRGRLANFRNSVVIMTSNLGSESFGRGASGLNVHGEAASLAEDHFVRAVQEFVRPEFFNRIDRVVPFLPLSGDVLLRIARRELEQLSFREGIVSRDIDLQWTEEVVREIVRLGYDARYGARPIKRVIDQRLVAPLAEALNSRATAQRLSGKIEVDSRKFRVRVRGVKGATDLDANHSTLLRSGTMQVVDFRRRVYRLRDSSGVAEIRTEIYRAVRAASRAAKRARRRAQRRDDELRSVGVIDRTVAPARDLIDRTTRLVSQAERAEDFALLEYFGMRQEVDMPGAADLPAMRKLLESIYFDLFAHLIPDSDRVTIVLYKDMADVRDSAMVRLAQVYHTIACENEIKVRLFSIFPCGSARVSSANRFLLAGATIHSPEGRAKRTESARRGGEERFEAEMEVDPAECLRNSRDGMIGVALELEGRLARPMFTPEEGLHVLEEKGSDQHCLVHISRGEFREYRPPEGVLDSARSAEHPLRRVYSTSRAVIEDKTVQRKEFWKRKGMVEIVQRLVKDRLFAEIRERVDEG